MTDPEPTAGVDVRRPLRRGLRRTTRALGLTWQPRPWWVRMCGVLASSFVTVLVFGLLAWEGTASVSRGWLPAAAAFLPGILLGAFAVGLGRWRTVVVYCLGLALLAGGSMYRISPPEHERIETVAVRVGVPEGWDRVTRAVNGNTWCFTLCPEMHYVYATADSDAETRRDFTALLEADGWDKDDAEATRRDDPENYQDWHKGRWHVTLIIRPVGSEGREHETTTPENLTEVWVLYRG